MAQQEITSSEMRLRVGKRLYPVASFEDASRKFSAARDEAMRQGLKPSDVGAPRIVNASGKAIAHISWNGRVWAGQPKDWKPGTVPLFDTFAA